MKNYYFKFNRLAGALAITIFGTFAVSSCKEDDKNANTPVVTSQKPAWGPTITDTMLSVINKLDSLNSTPLYALTAQEARKKPTPTDAVKELMEDYKIPKPMPAVDTVGRDIPVEGGMIHTRIYTPKGGAMPFPVIVYYHGGGWVIGDLDVYDASASALSEKVGAVVVSVLYRKSPEKKFPTAHKDAYEAYKWAVNNASTINGDPKKIAIAGESAGGNLAASVSMMARDSGVMMPLHQLLVYPIADNNTNTPSYQTYANAKPLSKPLMEWFFDKYLNTPADGETKWISLVDADLKNLPSTTIIAAEIDPLLSEGKILADKLQAAGSTVNYKLYKGVTHEFFGMATVISEARQAQAVAVEDLKKVFSK